MKIEAFPAKAPKLDFSLECNRKSMKSKPGQPGLENGRSLITF
jgi:hypothetical protein